MGELWFEARCWLYRFYREGPLCQEYLRMLKIMEQTDAETLRNYQNAQLQRVIRHCAKHVPYYRNVFRKLKLTPEDFRMVADLKKLPYLDKKTTMAHFDELISTRHRNILCKQAQTSGTTGAPGRFLRDFSSINFEQAALWRQWHGGNDYGHKRISLRGDIIVPSSRTRPPFWRYNPASRELQMSSYHLSVENSTHYIDQILTFQPQALYCFPSTGLLLARFFRARGVDYQFEAIFTSSEMLEAEVREEIESVFQCRIHDWYGQTERVAAIGQCAHGAYHIQEDYSIVELESTENGNELIGTHLYNNVMPLLRYRTGDHAVLSPEPGCACGSVFRKVESIQGRGICYLMTPEGRKISFTARIPIGVNNLIETQFIQEKPGEIQVCVLTNGRFTEKDRTKLIRNTLAYTSPRMKVTVREVPCIPRGPNGKFINIINTIGEHGA